MKDSYSWLELIYDWNLVVVYIDYDIKTYFNLQLFGIFMVNLAIVEFALTLTNDGLLILTL